jgi:hypothetical protein
MTKEDSDGEVVRDTAVEMVLVDEKRFVVLVAIYREQIGWWQ